MRKFGQPRTQRRCPSACLLAVTGRR